MPRILTPWVAFLVIPCLVLEPCLGAMAPDPRCLSISHQTGAIPASSAPDMGAEALALRASVAFQAPQNRSAVWISRAAVGWMMTGAALARDASTYKPSPSSIWDWMILAGFLGLGAFGIPPDIPSPTAEQLIQWFRKNNKEYRVFAAEDASEPSWLPTLVERLLSGTVEWHRQNQVYSREVENTFRLVVTNPRISVRDVASRLGLSLSPVYTQLRTMQARIKEIIQEERKAKVYKPLLLRDIPRAFRPTLRINDPLRGQQEALGLKLLHIRLLEDNNIRTVTDYIEAIQTHQLPRTWLTNSRRIAYIHQLLAQNPGLLGHLSPRASALNMVSIHDLAIYNVHLSGPLMDRLRHRTIRPIFTVRDLEELLDDIRRKRHGTSVFTPEDEQEIEKALTAFKQAFLGPSGGMLVAPRSQPAVKPHTPGTIEETLYGLWLAPEDSRPEQLEEAIIEWRHQGVLLYIEWMTSGILSRARDANEVNRLIARRTNATITHLRRLEGGLNYRWLMAAETFIDNAWRHAVQAGGQGLILVFANDEPALDADLKLFVMDNLDGVGLESLVAGSAYRPEHGGTGKAFKNLLHDAEQGIDQWWLASLGKRYTAWNRQMVNYPTREGGVFAVLYFPKKRPGKSHSNPIPPPPAGESKTLLASA